MIKTYFALILTLTVEFAFTEEFSFSRYNLVTSDGNTILSSILMTNLVNFCAKYSLGRPSGEKVLSAKGYLLVDLDNRLNHALVEMSTNGQKIRLIAKDISRFNFRSSSNYHVAGYKTWHGDHEEFGSIVYDISKNSWTKTTNWFLPYGDTPESPDSYFGDSDKYYLVEKRQTGSPSGLLKIIDLKTLETTRVVKISGLQQTNSTGYYVMDLYKNAILICNFWRSDYSDPYTQYKSSITAFDIDTLNVIGRGFVYSNYVLATFLKSTNKFMVLNFSATKESQKAIGLSYITLNGKSKRTSVNDPLCINVDPNDFRLAKIINNRWVVSGSKYSVSVNLD
jgi:hypothetical protein